MARVPMQKQLLRTKLLKEYASWVYCTGCNKTVAYLCYVTYDAFDFEYTCNCGNHGQVHIAFENENSAQTTIGHEPPTLKKNRLCCPNDEAPLVTFVDKNLSRYQYSIVCNHCNTQYSGANNN